MPILSLDFETFNTIDLKQVGADLYTSSPDFVVTVMAWAIDDEPVQSVACPSGLPQEIISHLAAGHRFRAWNASFEWSILFHHYGLTIPWNQVSCTMQKALYAGLPASLAAAGKALGLPASLQKDAAGQRLMMQMARPRLKGGKWHIDDPAKLAKLEAYCVQDVVAERSIARMIKPLPESERRVSALDHETNLRGISLDTSLIHELTRVASEATTDLNAACARLTNGAVTSPSSQTAKLGAWLASRGVATDGLDKGEVAKLLASPQLPALGDVRQVLEIRQEAAKSSTRKLVAMKRTAGPDDRVRGQILYYGAARTGRFSGRLIQPQNMPRPTLPPTVLKSAIQAIRKGLASEYIDAVYGSPLDVVAASLRSCLVPGPGRTFVTYDFRQIEARVLAWLAGQREVLGAFERGDDIYVLMQKAIGLPTRQAAKVVVLAAGFGMGPTKFRETAAANNLELTELQAKQMIDGWREANPEIVSFWYACERAARQSLFWPGNPVAVDCTNGKVSFTSSLDAQGKVRLAMKLPSARELFYRHSRVEPSDHKGGRLTYDGVDQKTHQWAAIPTWGGKLVENAVQAIARDCLVDAALRIDTAKLGDLVLSIHDELIWEVPLETAGTRSQSIRHEVEKSPTWGPDLPIASEGGIKTSYGV